MASNTVAGSSAGEGQGTVSGYTVSTIHYTVTNAMTGCASNPKINCVDGVSFTLTSKATTAPANGAPTKIQVTYEDTATGGAGVINWSSTTLATRKCTLSGWTTNSNAANSGTVHCTTGQFGVASLSLLDVEANQ